MEIKAVPIDDLGVLIPLIRSYQLGSKIDALLPRHHLWKGISPGEMVELLLSYFISQSDHRLSVIEDWAASRIEVLRWLMGNEQLESHDLNDDRIGNLLDLITKHAKLWEQFQSQQTSSFIEIYDLSKPEHADTLAVARIDTTTAQHHGSASGLLQPGYNVSKSPLAQLKIALLTIDNGNLPVSLRVVPGNEVDEPQYIPVLQQSWKDGLSKIDMLIVGDKKIATYENLSFIEQSGNFYLCPLPERLYSSVEVEEALDWIETNKVAPMPVMRQGVKEKEPKLVAKVVELPNRVMSDENGKVPEWTTRLVLVNSVNKRDQLLLDIEMRISKAQEKVKERFVQKQGRKTLATVKDAEQAVSRILASENVQHLFDVKVSPLTGNQKACTAELLLLADEKAKEQRRAGWRVMATNAPMEQLPPEKVILNYLEEFRVEQQFHLLLNEALALMPIYLKSQGRITALIRLLFLALQMSNLWQSTARKELAKEENPYLTNVVPGNPGMKVHRPTTQMLLKAFNGVILILVQLDNGSVIAKIQGWTETHVKILKLLSIREDAYLHPSCQ